MTTKVIAIRNKKNTPDEVYIGRGSKWGNPYSHLAKSKAQYRVETRDQAVESYETWIQTQPELLASLPELKGKTLVCYCKPASCHGDVLARLADKV